MNKDDAVFWDRIADMPSWEAEQELVSRRESNQLQLNMLAAERVKLAEKPGRNTKQEIERLGCEMDAVNRQMTLLTERIKYLRRLQDRIHWRNAVKAVFGEDAAIECAVWIERQWQDVYDQRRDWAKK